MTKDDKELATRIAARMNEDIRRAAEVFESDATRSGDIADVLRASLSIAADSFGVVGGIYAVLQYLKGRQEDLGRKFDALSQVVAKLPPLERKKGEEILAATKIELSVPENG